MHKPSPTSIPPVVQAGFQLPDNYQVPKGHWDELRGCDMWPTFLEHLGAPGLNVLDERLQELRRQVNDNGVTYNVYSATDESERPWSLDVLPLLLDANSWQQVERGVLQRVRLLEHIMADVYGPQTLMQRGLLPAALVQGHPGYLPAMQGHQPVGGRFLSLAAFDLARGPDGLWWLLAHRVQAPSGLGYLLENRILVSRQFPEAFEDMRIQRLASTYRALFEGLQARCPVAEGETPHLALLTPGPYNETYFEHAYLARYLGLTLVQAGDLTVRDDRLYLKTLSGLQRVHGLLKRVDDNWLDPLELRADSTLGVPGLLQAIRSGQVWVANTPGSGFLESNALLGFMPALAREVLDEELVLPAIPSWWCGEAAAIPDALRQLADGVIKPTYPQEGQRSSFEPAMGRNLKPREHDAWCARILRDPEAHTVQQWLPSSYQPVWTPEKNASSGLQSRAVVLRVFAVTDAQGQWQVLPGGFARLSAHDGYTSMQRGGSTADVWVQAREEESVSTVSLLNQGNPHVRRERHVTSRAAENLFWMGRYTERSENTVRFVRVALDVLASQHQQQQGLMDWIHAMAELQGLVPSEVMPPHQSPRVFERSLVSGLWDVQSCTSVSYNLRSMAGCASHIRDRLSPEHWLTLEQLQELFDQRTSSVPNTAQALHRLTQVSQLLAAITGAQTDRMTRDDGWRLLSVGRHVERLDFLATALELAIEHQVLDHPSGFETLLALFDSTITFHAQFQQNRSPQALVELLVCSADNPRSLQWVARTLRSRLLRLQHLGSGATRMLADWVTGTNPETLAPSVLWPEGEEQPRLLLDALAHDREVARHVSDGLASAFFAHSESASHNVSL
jgi:uncharacterized circularly permuted ATP-grasp superfamily protein/uncharacterized alpha-E superfamily protein